MLAIFTNVSRNMTPWQATFGRERGFPKKVFVLRSGCAEAGGMVILGNLGEQRALAICGAAVSN